MVEELSTVANFLKDYGTIIAIPAAALVGSIAYVFQKFTDQKAALIELRRKSYTAYLESLFNLIAKINPENNHIYNLKLMELAAVASDEVVRQVARVQMIFDNTVSGPAQVDPANSKIIIGEVVLAMRKDCFESSRLTVPEIIKITPIGYSK